MDRTFPVRALEYIFNAQLSDNKLMISIDSYLLKPFVAGIFRRTCSICYMSLNDQMNILQILIENSNTASDILHEISKTMIDIRNSTILEYLLHFGMAPNKIQIEETINKFTRYISLMICEETKHEYRKMIIILEDYQTRIEITRPEVHDSLEFLPEDMQRMCCEFVVVV